LDDGAVQVPVRVDVGVVGRRYALDRTAVQQGSGSYRWG
jgi:hypothetical protein